MCPLRRKYEILDLVHGYLSLLMLCTSGWWIGYVLYTFILTTDPAIIHYRSNHDS